MIIIVFGLAASGKTYIGKILNKYFNFYHEDADFWLSEDMQDYVKEKKQFTLNMLDHFTVNIISNIEKLNSKYDNIVITQALYRQKNRDAIKEYFLSKNQDILFIQVDANDELIHQRLLARGDWVQPDYASSMRKFFQPMIEATLLSNNQDGEEFIINQLFDIPSIEMYKKL